MLTCLAYLLGAVALLAQVNKGASPLNPQSSIPNPTSQTRAVVIGISDYQDPAIPDLRFADRDAEAFAEWLRSLAGGNLPDEHLNVLINDNATAGKIIAALEWLIAESKSGERAFIYFSGHGDVERVTKFQRGYLLARDSPPSTYMAGGSLPVGFLSDVVTTLSESGVQVVIVSDACRSGKLAGSANGGTQATSAALAQQFSNEIKILSCQPEEFSLEGEQWGGGRGCFSFHLVDALTGMADTNLDGTVSLMEAGRYLEDKVPSETAPHSQIPMTIGSKSTALSVVEERAVAELRKRKLEPTLSPIDAKGFEDVMLAKLDTSVQLLYSAFTAALERGDLMSPVGASANDFYLQLLHKPGIEKLRGLMTRNLAAALQDEAQVVINQLLKADPSIVDDVFAPIAKYDHLPAYLHRAGELLGERHYMYKYVKAREYYFKAKTFRKENYPDLTPDSLLKLALASLDTSLVYDEEASYAYFEKGCITYWGKRNHINDARKAFELASSLTPSWILPKYYISRTLISPLINEKQKRVEILYEVIRMDSSFLPAYRELGWANEGEQAKIWFESYVRRMYEMEKKSSGRLPIAYYNYLGNSLWRLNRNEEAKSVLSKGILLSKGSFPLLYSNLCIVEIGLGNYEEAENAAMKLIELMPTNYEGYYVLAEIRQHFTKKMDKVPELLKQAINMGSTSAYNDLTYYYMKHEAYDSALTVIGSWLEKVPNYPQARLLKAKIYELQEKVGSAKMIYGSLFDNNISTPYFQNAIYYQLIARLKTNEDLNYNDFLEVACKQSENPANVYFWAASAFAFCKQPSTSLFWLEKSLQSGWEPGPTEWLLPTLHNPDFDEIRLTSEYKALMKKYFPDQAKD